MLMYDLFSHVLVTGGKEEEGVILVIRVCCLFLTFGTQKNRRVVLVGDAHLAECKDFTS